ncbi:aspartate--ammonia ligase [Chitinophaga arvensicola]|uniref:Aspartate--ammonia ligase n=1 Tax=Chitinophaga arvensicola TaxID=29529 RepID=A0A1I0QYX5_9BACT|nr:aspartate--ammonia ligase [Chitinophaga arvensicola]SEW33113.1 aspartate-ammonia ligase [Chitinophaga arvensicola]
MKTVLLSTQNELLTREKNIAHVKDVFAAQLGSELSLIKVSAPLFVKSGTGFNDDLNGIERPVRFRLNGIPEPVEIVHSLAKWKRMRLHQLGMAPGQGIITDMRAIRPDEEVSPVHSFYVDQWDWEKVISPENRNLHYLKYTVKHIYAAIQATNSIVGASIGKPLQLPSDIHFIHSEELLGKYPALTPKERENAIAKEYGAVFIMGIGGELSNQQIHDHRAPDYDDWSTSNDDGYTGLNGDIVLWNPVLNSALEISSMGIRVDATAMQHQLRLKKCTERAELEFHANILNETYPITMGGGIGQSRLCMFLLQQAHIADVQSSIWS